MDQIKYEKIIDKVIAFLQVITQSRTLMPDQQTENVRNLIAELRQLRQVRNDRRLRKLIGQIAAQFTKSDTERVTV